MVRPEKALFPEHWFTKKSHPGRKSVFLEQKNVHKIIIIRNQ